MKDTFDKPPIRIDHEPAIGAPVIAVGQQRPQRLPRTVGLTDLPVWVMPMQRRLDTILRQQDEILYHLQHPWRVRWQRWRALIKGLFT